MKENLEQRAEELALYLIENRATVRAATKKYGVSKSTLHTVVCKWSGDCGWQSKGQAFRKQILHLCKNLI